MPSLVWAYWMRGSMAGILYASGLSLSRCHWMDRAISRRWLVRQEALATVGPACALGLGGCQRGLGAPRDSKIDTKAE